MCFLCTNQKVKDSRKESPVSDAPTTTILALIPTCDRKCTKLNPDSIVLDVRLSVYLNKPRRIQCEIFFALPSAPGSVFC